MSIAQTIVDKSKNANFIVDWRSHAVNAYAGKSCKGEDLIEFADNSAVCFTPDGKPAVYFCS